MFELLQRLLNGKSSRPPIQNSGETTVGLLVAAGRSSRFDPSGTNNKLLAELDGMPVVCHSAIHLAEAVSSRIAVVRPDAYVLDQKLTALGFTVVRCPDAHSGMGHSISWGVAEALKRFECERIVVALGDMPFVQSSTIAKLIGYSKITRAVVAPRYQGKRGNPVVFNSDHFEALSRLSGDKGAAQYMTKIDVSLVDVDDPGILKDIDTPEDLAQQ